MPYGTCDQDGCENEYEYAERGEDSLFVSYAVSPHDVEGIEKRAFSVCESCAQEIGAVLPNVEAGDE